MKLRPISLPFLTMTHRTARPMSRDKADTLLLLCACTLVLAPHASQVPLWIALVCGTLLLWRGWSTFRGNRLPPRWLLLPVAVLAMAGVYITFKTLLGREAGVAMLVLLLGLKLLEMHAKRDLFVVVFLNFFLMLASFFNSQSIGTALMTVLSVILMLTAQLSFQYTGLAPPLMRRIKASLLIVALAVPLTLVMFVLFPRIQGPLWGMPGDANTGRSGLSETMTPGNIAQLALSDGVAFRVKFIDPVPAKSKLYWRGIVLSDYDGRTWKHQPVLNANRSSLFEPRGKPIRHQVTLEPHGQRWLFALELPALAPVLPNMPAVIRADRHLSADQPIQDRLRYEVASYIEYDLQANETRTDQQRWLRLPAGYNPATRAFATRLLQATDNDLQFVNAVLKHFREEAFRYTLEPPLLGRHAMDEFLFGTRAGFCEHYASAFVVLMRAAGIPARVVTGYQGGEINPVDGFMTVRQSDAHAWAEIWLDKRGWLRIDPTAAVAPSRIDFDLSRTLPRSGLAGMLNLNQGSSSWLASWRFNWDAVANGWNQWVLNYSPDKQKSFMKSLGLNDVNWQTLALLLLVTGALVVAVIAVPLVTNRQKIDPIQAVYLRFCKTMARKGLARAPHEGPRDYRIRIMQAESALPAAKKTAAERFLTCYERAQYGTVSDFPATAIVAQLKSLLNQSQ